jgi:signal transduction histidine kinase
VPKAHRRRHHAYAVGRRQGVSDMLEEILLVVIVLVVAVLMAVDVARTRDEGLHGHAEGHAFDAKRPIAAPSVGSRESFSRAHLGSAMPVAVQDAGPARHSAGPGPSAGADPRSHANAAAVPRGSRRRLRDWHVRSRLLLLVIIPLAAAAVIGLCVSYIIDARHEAHANSNGSVLSALAAGVAIIVVVLTLWFTIAVARSVLRPLQRLRMGALELAGPRLAEAVRSASQSSASQSSASQSSDNTDGAPFDLKPVDVDASDEIGEIARAFDELRRELLRLAVGETARHGKLNATFVDLSHRGQSFMERQIRLLHHLEQGEPDAQRLATLIRVKGIGNRMHRHSENMLILVGHEQSSNWNQPVALANVIRAAVSELEEYQRVSVNAQPDVAVVGPAVNDVVHLLIELTENATSFSAADMQVDISGRTLTSGGVLLQITDRGVGMTPKELAYANWRMENPPMADTSIPKWIGLLVVARLAARHGIGIRLQSADFGGLTALVWLPDEVLTEQGTMAATRLGGSASAGSRRGLHEAVPDPGYATAQREVAAARFAPPPAHVRDTRLDRRSVPDAGLPSAEPWSPGAPRSAPRAGSHATVGSPGAGLPEALGAYPAVADQPDPDFRNVPAGGVTGRNLAAGPDAAAPGGNERSPAASALPGTAAPLGQDTSSAAPGVIVPPARDREGEQRLPVFNALESRWFGKGHSAPSLPGHTSAAGSRWSSPADGGWRAASAADSPSSAGSTAAGLPQRLPNANLVPGTIPSAEPTMPNRSPAAARDRLASLQRGIDKGRAATGQVASPGEDEEAQPGSAG